MIFGEFDARLKPQSGKAKRCRRRLGGCQQPLAEPPALRLRENGELADIETVGLRPQKQAADQLFVFDDDMTDLGLGLFGQGLRRQLECGRWRVDPAVHRGEGSEDECQQFVPAREALIQADDRHRVCPYLSRRRL
ncbi:UNVERIFIED_ORG: hypothetical protein GGE44_003709 [Rhizobium esperanzae]